MSHARRSLAGRDQSASVFSAALLRLCDALGAAAAALVDGEGETVDYAGRVTPFDIRLAAAEWAIVLAVLRGTPALGWSDTRQVLVRGTHKSYFVQVLEGGYALVVQLPPRAFGVSALGLAEAVRELCAEAGFAVPQLAGEPDHFRHVDVRCGRTRRSRPTAVWSDGAWLPFEILGRWESPRPRRQVGYRVRLPGGAEATLVREPAGRWYADAGLPGR